MKSRLLSGKILDRVKRLTPALALVRLAVMCSILAVGGLAAQAAAPVLTLQSTYTVAEDSSTDLDIGVTDTAVPIFTVVTSAKSSNTNLVSNSSLVFSGSGTNRLLSITPGLHKSGTTTITVIATDSQPASTTNTFTLTVTFTNYPPVFLTYIGNLTRNENAHSTNLSFSISDIQTASSNLTVSATSTNTSLVPNTNLVFSGAGSNRTLTLTQATNQNGTTLIELVVTDAFGSTSTNQFVLTVLPVNQPPAFTLSTNRLVYGENYGLVTYSNFVTGVASGPTNQSSESNYFVLTYNTNFFVQAPAVDTNGTLTFQSGTNLFGTNTITFVLFNNGPTTNGGKDSLTNTLTLDVPFVTQPPTNNLVINFFLVNEETTNVTVSATNLFNYLSVGPPNQSSESFGFAAMTATNDPTNVVFTQLPAVATNGTLTFKPAAHSFGTNLVTLVMTNSGGTNNGGVNSFTNSLTIAVAQTNHAPFIVGASNQTVLENGTNLVNGTNGLTMNILLWSYDTNFLLPGTNFSFTATASNTNLASVSVTATNTPGASNQTFAITFTLGTNVNGSVTNTLIATEGPLSTTNTVVLTITPVTQPPSYVLVTNLVLVNEETTNVTVSATNFLSSMLAGPPDQISEKWGFVATTATNSITNVAFTVLPAVATNGTLTFKPAAHSFGTNLVTLVMTNSGSTNNGGINSYTNSFMIGVIESNHAPFIVGASNQTVLENGTNLVNGTNGLTMNILLWDYDTNFLLPGTNFTFTATASNTNLASVSVTATNTPGASNQTFAITFTLVTNANGSVTNTLIATEGPLSTTNTFVLTITPVTQPPSYALVTNLVLVNEETTNVTVSATNFLSSMLAGPSNQISEKWGFVTTTATNSITNVAFTVLPSVATNGTLTFKPAAHSFGTNIVTLVMTNTGSTNNGGINSYTNSFMIGVVETNHAPFIVGASNQTVLENGTNLVNGTNGLTMNILLWSYDTNFLLPGTNFTFTATASNTNLASLSVTTTNTPGASNQTFAITFTLVTNANGSVTNTLIATEGPLSTTNTFVLTITPVTQPPSYALVTNLVLVNEETTNVTLTATNFLSSMLAGPPNQISEKWGFVATTATNSITNVAFTVLPSVATNGTLTFSPTAHSFGTNLVTLVMTNTGSTTNGGVNSYTNSFMIGVVETNHAPFIVGASNQTVLENGTNLINGTNGLTMNILLWSYDTNFLLPGTNFTFTATASNTNLASVSVTATNTPGASNQTFAITFTLVTNANGKVTNTLIATEGPLSTTNTFVLTITPVTQPPSYALVTNLVLVNEETTNVTVSATNFLSSMLAGPPNQSSESWGFLTTTATNSITNVAFTVLPAVATNGTLTFKPAAHSFGTNIVTLVMTNTGSTNNGGINSYTNSFMIGVVETNHAPFIVGASNQTVLENGTNLVNGTNGLTMNILLWSYDTNFLLPGTNFSFTATASNTNLASLSVTTTNTPGASNQTFAITFTLVTNANGSVTNTLIATEGPLSTTNTFVLTITPVTQPPSYALVTNLILVNEETTNVTLTATNFLSSMLAGPPNQISEKWGFVTTTATNSITNVAFTVLPSVATNGTLTFKPAAHSFGTNIVTLVMTNTGSTNNGGINSYTNSFMIGVVETNHAPFIVGASNQTILENGTNLINGTNGLTMNILLWSYDTNFLLPGTNFSFTATASNTNLASVSVTATNTPGASNQTFAITFTLGTNANGSVTNTLIATEGPLSTTNTFVLTITPVTQPPSYALVTNLVLVNEETTNVTVSATNFLSSMLSGPPNQKSESWGFVATTATNSITNVAFTVLPAVATNGTLTFKPAAHSFGTNIVTLVMTNTGSTNNGGINSYTNSFMIGVVETNHAPFIVGASNQTVMENGTNLLNGTNGLTMNILLWSYDTNFLLPGTNFSFTATASNTNLASLSVTATNTPGASNQTFAITFTLVTNVNGKVTNTLIATEGPLSTTNTFVLTINPVTEPPSYALVTNLVLVNEETTNVTVSATNFLSSMLAGPPNQSNESWGFVATTATNSITNVAFTVLPAVATNGTLTFKPAAHSFGTNLVTLVMTNSGSTNTGGVNSYTNSFMIGVVETNHAPFIVGASNQTVLENGTNLVNGTNGLTMNILLWDYDTNFLLPGTNFSFTATASNTNLASVSVTATNAPGASNQTFAITFTLVTNANGSVTNTLIATEGPLSTTNTFVLTITPVTQPPSYALVTNLVLVNEETTNVTVSATNFLSSMLAGPSNQISEKWA